MNAAMKLKMTFSLGKRSYYKPRCILKSRDITLLTKICIFKAMVFPVVRYRCERGTIKKTECQTEASELWFLRRFS